MIWQLVPESDDDCWIKIEAKHNLRKAYRQKIEMYSGKKIEQVGKMLAAGEVQESEILGWINR